MHRTHLLIFTFSHFLILECDFFFGGVAGAVGGGDDDFVAGDGGVGGCGGVCPFTFDESCVALFDWRLVGVFDLDFDGDDFEGVGDLDDDFLVCSGSGVCGVVYLGDDRWA